MNKPTPPPGHPLHVTAEETVLDEWSTDSARCRLVERAGIYRLEVWELYRWVGVEHGLQAVARRVADLTRGRRSISEKVLPITARRTSPSGHIRKD